MPTIQENRAKIDAHIQHLMDNFTPEERLEAMSELIRRLRSIAEGEVREMDNDKLRPTDTRCILCNDTGVMQLAGGMLQRKCVCVSMDRVTESQAYGNDCPSGSCEV